MKSNEMRRTSVHSQERHAELPPDNSSTEDLPAGKTIAVFEGSFAPLARPPRSAKPWYRDREYFVSGWTSKQIWKAAFVEGVATAGIVYVSGQITATLINYGSAQIGAYVGLSTFFLLTVFIYATAAGTGGHMNPMITFSAMISGICPVPRGLFCLKNLHTCEANDKGEGIIYLIGQTTGSALAGGLLRGTWGRERAIRFQGGGCFYDTSQITASQAFLNEITSSFILLYLAYGVGLDPRQALVFGPRFGPILVGFSVAIIAFASSGVVPGYAGAQMHPARCFGYGIARQDFEGQWIWWFGPAIAAMLLALIDRCIANQQSCRFPVKSNRGRKQGSTNKPDTVEKLLARIRGSSVHDQVVAALLQSSAQKQTQAPYESFQTPQSETNSISTIPAPHLLSATNSHRRSPSSEDDSRRPLCGDMAEQRNGATAFISPLHILAAAVDTEAASRSPSPYPAAPTTALSTNSEADMKWSIAMSVKSLETIQAIIIMQYWAPVSTRQLEDPYWLFLNHATQLAREIAGKSEEFKMRLKRNFERTWLYIFVADKSFGIITGRSLRVSWKDMPDNAGNWWQESCTVPWDRMVSGLVAMRRSLLEVNESSQDRGNSITSIVTWHDHAFNKLTQFRIDSLATGSLDYTAPVRILGFYHDHSILVFNAQAPLRYFSAPTKAIKRGGQAITDIEKATLKLKAIPKHLQKIARGLPASSHAPLYLSLSQFFVGQLEEATSRMNDGTITNGALNQDDGTGEMWALDDGSVIDPAMWFDMGFLTSSQQPSFSEADAGLTTTSLNDFTHQPADAS
ncbi:putative aquaporin TIP2-1 [Paramyrothecium foliicola]|nr:putative aquaporin TIP2-1 [Paramyrothecium foliicola]